MSVTALRHVQLVAVLTPRRQGFLFGLRHNHHRHHERRLVLCLYHRPVLCRRLCLDLCHRLFPCHLLCSSLCHLLVRPREDPHGNLRESLHALSRTPCYREWWFLPPLMNAMASCQVCDAFMKELQAIQAYLFCVCYVVDSTASWRSSRK